MKMNALKIYQRERMKGRGLMKTMEEAWDMMYDDIPISAQKLRDNAARFQKDKALLNLLEMREEADVEPDIFEPANAEEQSENRMNQPKV